MSALPDSVRAIDKNAFLGCESLKSVAFGSGLQSIAAKAFYDCGLLESIWFDAEAPTIGAGAFAGGRSGSDFVVYGAPGSGAEEYARKNGFRFEAIASRNDVK